MLASEVATMSVSTASTGPFRLRARQGDAKTLLSWELDDAATSGLAGFTIIAQPPGGAAYFLYNRLTFADPSAHAQDPAQPTRASINSPFHAFRWVHHPGLVHQRLQPNLGRYSYTVTPRYFVDRSMAPIDHALGASLTIEVAPFRKGRLRVGFTRGFVQSQAYADHFGPKATFEPHDPELVWDTSQIAGVATDGTSFTFEDQHRWLGFTARPLILELLDEVRADPDMTLDVFAYDLNEPAILTRLLDPTLAARTRIILDNAALHHDAKPPPSGRRKPEDEFAERFVALPGSQIKRGHFGRYSHNKVLIASRKNRARKVLTGSTNFSTTGLYVNSNHVLVFDDPKVATTYRTVFDATWDGDVARRSWLETGLDRSAVSFATAHVPSTTIHFSPHSNENATSILGGLLGRLDHETTAAPASGRSVLFAVMELSTRRKKGSPPASDDERRAGNPVYFALNELHADPACFSYGISDNPDGIKLYRPGQPGGVLVTGKPTAVRLPPPFNQVPRVAGHQIHHKFVVCGFNGEAPVVYCGSSNLALRGEQVNGDNLIEINDPDVATAFAIEAIELVDHFNFLNRCSTDGSSPKINTAKPVEAAARIGWHLGTTDLWVHKFYDPDDLRCRDRCLFAQQFAAEP